MIKYKSNRGIAQLVARLSGGQEVVSSSLATPTRKSTKFFKALSILLFSPTNFCVGEKPIRKCIDDRNKVFNSKIISAQGNLTPILFIQKRKNEKVWFSLVSLYLSW